MSVGFFFFSFFFLIQGWSCLQMEHVNQHMLHCSLWLVWYQILSPPTLLVFVHASGKWTVRKPAALKKTIKSSFRPILLQCLYNQVWPGLRIRFVPLSFLFLRLIDSAVTCPWPCDCSKICWIGIDLFFPPSQLQHCLPVHLLLSRAHSQSSGGTQHREPPPAPHHKLSRPAPSGCPGALLNWTKRCTQEPFW